MPPCRGVRLDINGSTGLGGLHAGRPLRPCGL